MTKKSFARLQRDAKEKEIAEAKKTNNCWSELNDTFENITQSIAVTNMQLAQTLQDSDIYKYLENPTEVATAIRAHSQDILNFNKELAGINALHKERTGGLTDADDLMAALRVGEQYMVFHDRYNAIVIPTINHILEEFGKAAQKRYDLTNKAIDEQKDLVDPNVVTDVVIKESKPAAEVQ